VWRGNFKKTTGTVVIDTAAKGADSGAERVVRGPRQPRKWPD
jgi:hypothetical protein